MCVRLHHVPTLSLCSKCEPGHLSCTYIKDNLALGPNTFDNTIGDTPPDVLGLTILIPTLIVWLLIVLKATWLCFCSKREVA